MEAREEEKSTDEMIKELTANHSGRYVLVGSSQSVAEGSAIIFDTTTRMVSWFDENTELHRSVIRRMVDSGTRVFEKVADIPKFANG